MKMFSMKSPKPKKGDKETLAEPMNGPPGDVYPWGLRLTLENEQLVKVKGLAKADVGDELTFHAKVQVVAKRESERQGDKGPDKSMELQITACCVDDPESFEAGYTDKDEDD